MHRPEPELLTYRGASERYAIKLTTLYALVSQQRIPHVRIGRRFVRFRVAELDRWFAQRAVPASGDLSPHGAAQA